MPLSLRHSLVLGASLLLAGRAPAIERAAEDYFHSGAQFYISNNIPAAKQFVEQGLKRYPQDEKLQKLEELLKQQQQQQNQQSQSSQQNQSPKDQNQSNQSPQKSDQSKADEQKNREQEEKQKQQEQQQSQADRQNEQKDQPDEEKAQPGEMTKREANRLLDGQKDSEQLLQFKPKPKPQDKRIKDW